MNSMPTQLPASITNVGSIVAQWVKNIRGATITDDLDREERQWFWKQWASDAIAYYKSKGFEAQLDLAAVTVLLGRGTEEDQAPPLATDPVNASRQTKYDSDLSLAGKAREKTKKNAAKRLKKQQIQSGKKADEDGNDGKGGGMGGTEAD